LQRQRLLIDPEMLSIFGAMATSTSTLPACITLSAPNRPRLNINAKAKVVSSMSLPSTAKGRPGEREVDLVETGSSLSRVWAVRRLGSASAADGMLRVPLFALS
jgi:hypothetical protein